MSPTAEQYRPRVTTPDAPVPADPAVLADFWSRARAEHPALPVRLPEAWAFGATRAHADGLLALVLEGTKVATASSAWDYADEDEPLPAPGDLSVILDGTGRPRTVLEVTAVAVVPFDQVTEEHAHAEGEDDRTLASWRRIHERFWHEHSAHGVGPDMPVVCERFRTLTVHPAR